MTRRRALDELQRRYTKLLSRRWNVRRSVRVQVDVFVERMRLYLQEAPRAGRIDRRMLGWVDRGLDSGVRVDRDFVFAHLARLRDSASPRELARIAAFAQALYLDGGALGHEAEPTAAGRRCLIYPGRFAARLTDDDPRRARLAAPPFAPAVRPEVARRRLAALGVSVDAVLTLPADELLEIASAPEWQRVRDAEDVPPEIGEELRARFAAVGDVRDGLPAAADLLPAAPPSPAPRMPAPWQLATQAVLVTALPTEAAGEQVLELSRLALRCGDRWARLTKAEAELCVAVAIAGDAGLPVHHWKQLKADADQLATAGAGERPLAWQSQRDEPRLRDDERRALLAVTRNHANRALAAVGIELRIADHRLYLIGPDQQPSVPRLEGTLWDLLGEPADAAAAPGLSPTDHALYLALAAASPATLPIRALAAAVGKDDDEPGLKQTVDALAKLARRLIVTGAPVRLCRIRRGLYALVPASAAPGEVH